MFERRSEQLAGVSEYEAGGYDRQKRCDEETVTQYKHCDGKRPSYAHTHHTCKTGLSFIVFYLLAFLS